MWYEFTQRTARRCGDMESHSHTKDKEEDEEEEEEDKIPDTRYKKDTGYKMQDTGYKMQDTRYRIQDTQGHQLQRSRDRPGRISR